MGQIGTRITHTVQQGTVVGLDDLAKVAQGANQKGHIRLKETGGDLQIYGHASGAASLFHRRNADRQDAGTEMVARSVLAFAEGKGPAVMEKARQLIEPFVQGGHAIKRMTNADVVQIEREMRSFATKEQQSLKEAASDILGMSRALHRVDVNQIQIDHKGNLFDALRSNVQAFVKIIDVAKAKYPDRQDFLEFSRDKGLPELRAGFVLAALDDLRRGFDLGPREVKVFKALLEPFADPDTRSPVDDLFDRYKDVLHEDGRFDDLACEVSDLIFKKTSIGNEDRAVTGRSTASTNRCISTTSPPRCIGRVPRKTVVSSGSTACSPPSSGRCPSRPIPAVRRSWESRSAYASPTRASAPSTTTVSPWPPSVSRTS